MGWVEIGAPEEAAFRGEDFRLGVRSKARNQQAAVRRHREARAVREAAGCHGGRDGADIPWGSNARGQRQPVRNPLLVALQDRPRHVGLDYPGLDFVDVDAFRSQARCEALSDHGHGGFRDAVFDSRRCDRDSVRRGDIDNGVVRAGFAVSGKQTPDERLSQEEHCARVHRKAPVEAFRGNVQHIAPGQDADSGVVHKGGQWAQLRLDIPKQARVRADI